MSQFTNFVALQEDLAHLLLSDHWLDEINIIARHKLLNADVLARLPAKTTAAEQLVYIEARNARKGCGVIVEKPELDVTKPNLPGPHADLIIVFLVLEDRLVNEAPLVGTLIPADQVAQRILENVHGWLHRYQSTGTGTQGAFIADPKAITAAPDWEPLNAYRVRVRCQLSRFQTDRALMPTISVNGLNVTLTNQTDDAEIYYTTDESFPGRSNKGAILYSGPFDVIESGTVLRWAAYRNDLMSSHVTTQIIE